MKLRLELPYLPPQELSPNWKPFTPRAMWVYKRARDRMITDVYMLGVNALVNAKLTNKPAFARIAITYTFIVSENRNRDGDNWVARMKPAQDALVYAGFVADDTHDRVVVNPPKFVVKKGKKETIIDVEELQEKLGGANDAGD